jgi:hypothetical protein
MTKFNLSLFKNFSLKKFKANHKTNNTSLFSEVAEFLQTLADALIAKWLLTSSCLQQRTWPS